MKYSAFGLVFLAALFCSLQVAPTAGLGWSDPCKFVPFPFSVFCKAALQAVPKPGTEVNPSSGSGSGSGSGNGEPAKNATETAGNATRSLPIVGKLPLGLPLR